MEGASHGDVTLGEEIHDDRRPQSVRFQNFLHLRRPEIVSVIDRWAKHVAFVSPLLLELLIGRFGLRETGLGDLCQASPLRESPSCLRVRYPWSLEMLKCRRTSAPLASLSERHWASSCIAWNMWRPSSPSAIFSSTHFLTGGSSIICARRRSALVAWGERRAR